MSTPLLRYTDPSGLPAGYFTILGCGDVIESQADPRTDPEGTAVVTCPVHGPQAAPTISVNGG